MAGCCIYFGCCLIIDVVVVVDAESSSFELSMQQFLKKPASSCLRPPLVLCSHFSFQLFSAASVDLEVKLSLFKFVSLTCIFKRGFF